MGLGWLQQRSEALAAMNTTNKNLGDYDPSELIALCSSILEDGEISGDEIYQLAEKLNGHREACFSWPGNLLVKPLQDVWSDGKVTKLELRQIARVLVQIRKDWAKQQTAAAFEQAVKVAEQIAREIDLSQPRMPAIPFVVHVKSHTEPGIVYEVDLSGPTCTCPDWRTWRSSLPPAHLTRCCKHVFEAYTQLEPESGWPGWLGAFLDLSRPPHPQQEWMIFHIDRKLVLASTAPTGWANVFVQVGHTYDQFGYCIFEDRWAYGIEPPAGDRIRKAIVAAMVR